MKKTKFEVAVKATTGTLDGELFKLMAARGDVTSTSIKELVNAVFSPQGDAICHITTDNDEMDRTYIDTDEFGIIHTGSPTFLSGYETYKTKCERMRIVAVKAKLGTCYKCVPVFSKTQDETVPFEE